MIILNGKNLDVGSFPNFESYIAIEDLKVKKRNEIRWEWETDDEFIHLAMLVHHLRSLNCASVLSLPYMPYSRMDRVNGSYVVSLKAVASFINSLKFKEVHVREPHSEVTLKLIDNCVPHWWVKDRIKRVMEETNSDSLFFPDYGACVRYGEHYEDVAYAKKKRDFASGRIVQYDINGVVGKRVLIVDDLCSRGGTFIEASQRLISKRRVEEVNLLVAHCEHNVFTGPLFKHINKLYTAKDQWLNKHDQIIGID